MVDVYYEKEICYSDNINKKAEYKWSDQMEAAQRIRLIRIIEKMEKNPAFSNKLGIKNTSEYLAEKMKDTYQNEFQKEKKMLSLLFTICIIWFVGKFFVFGLRASWGIMKLLCTVIFFPVILIGMVVGGLMYIAFPLLIVGGIIALVTSHS